MKLSNNSTEQLSIDIAYSGNDYKNSIEVFLRAEHPVNPAFYLLHKILEYLPAPHPHLKPPLIHLACCFS